MIDLFAGIGGFHLALAENNVQCVFASEIDTNAQQTYLQNFPNTPLYSDITNPNIQAQIPQKFDILCAGFPCQPFSIAGFQKGFNDTRGMFIFDIINIVKKHRPKVIFLENVKNLKSHDNGHSHNTIKKAFRELNYFVYNKVLSPHTHINIPQNRERLFMVGFDLLQIENYLDFNFPQPVLLTNNLNNYFENNKVNDIYYYNKSSSFFNLFKREITKKNTFYQLRRSYVREMKSKVCPTLPAAMGMGGNNIPIILDNYGIRKLTPRECFNFQGYPRDFQFPETLKNHALYKQIGNSVCVPLVSKIAKEIIKVLQN